jgi:hypothetical protein
VHGDEGRALIIDGKVVDDFQQRRQSAGEHIETARRRYDWVVAGDRPNLLAICVAKAVRQLAEVLLLARYESPGREPQDYDRTTNCPENRCTSYL